MFSRFVTRFDGEESCRRTIVEFAAAKLINAPVHDLTKFTRAQKLACLSQRLPIIFNSTNYHSQEQEMKQVEAHMRVCLKIDSHNQSMTSLSPSEPILSEAAFALMQREDFNAPKALMSILRGFSIHKGDVGELLVLLLMTLARDSVVCSRPRNNKAMWRKMEASEDERGWDRVIPVVEFLRKLFKVPARGKDAAIWAALFEEFKGSKMHFNHFVKVHELASLKVQYLMGLMARGAAVLCANCQPGVDAAVLSLRESDTIQRSSVQLILTQSKNDPAYGAEPVAKLFKKMDPFALGILDDTDDPLPVIRIVFALAAKEPALHISVEELKARNKKRYTAYNVWCAGLTAAVLAPIKKESEGIWQTLCQGSRGWEDPYKEGKRVVDLRMTMNPGAATRPQFWSQWYEFHSK